MTLSGFKGIVKRVKTMVELIYTPERTLSPNNVLTRWNLKQFSLSS